jgi:hypothetical protein
MDHFITLKRGDSLIFEIELLDQAELPLTDIQEIRSQIRTRRHNLIDEFHIEPLGNGIFRFSVQDTTKYPIDDLVFDIEIIKNGLVSSSETITLRIVRDVTYNE